MMNLNERKVCVVLVNWMQAVKTIEAVRSALNQTLKPKIIVVVDNGSNDDSIEKLKNEFAGEETVRLLARHVNGGFGAGCNEGIEVAMSEGCEYVWLLNNDAKAKNDCLEKMIMKISADKNIGAIGSNIFDTGRNVSGHAACTMNELTLECNEVKNDDDINARKYSWITGASMLIRISVILKVGMFDQKFFMYWEDADLCHRIRKCGYKIALSKDAIVHHEAGTSSVKIITERYKWHLESQLRWIVKNYDHKRYGIIIVYIRHVIKSILTMNMNRLSMTLKIMMKNKL